MRGHASRLELAELARSGSPVFPEFSFPQLYVITDTAPRPGSEAVRTHEEIVRAATEAGARIVQIRDKSSDTQRLVKEVERCVKVVEVVRGILFVNDRVDVALAAGAHGIHLGDEDMPVGKARELAGDGRLIGASVATLEEAKAAIAAGADYVSVGAIFATQTKLDAGEPVGCERLREIKQGVTVPVAAIGGINRTNLRSVVEASADMICVVSAITAAEDMVEATRTLVGLIGRGGMQRRLIEGGSER